MSCCSLNTTNFYALDNALAYSHVAGVACTHLAQAVAALLYGTASPSDENNRQTPQVNMWLRITATLSRDGPWRARYAAQIGGSTADAVEIKMTAVNEPVDDEAARIEYTLMLHLNRLRDTCPNFQLALGIFCCGAQPFELAYPAPARPDGFGDLQSGRFDRIDVLAVILQVVCALKLAQDTYNFVHNNLHAGMIMLQTVDGFQDVGVDGYVQIPYMMDGQLLKLRTRYIAIITGFEHARLDLCMWERVDSPRIRRPMALDPAPYLDVWMFFVTTNLRLLQQRNTLLAGFVTSMFETVGVAQTYTVNDIYVTGIDNFYNPLWAYDEMVANWFAAECRQIVDVKGATDPLVPIGTAMKNTADAATCDDPLRVSRDPSHTKNAPWRYEDISTRPNFDGPPPVQGPRLPPGGLFPPSPAPPVPAILPRGGSVPAAGVRARPAPRLNNSI